MSLISLSLVKLEAIETESFEGGLKQRRHDILSLTACKKNKLKKTQG